MTFPAAPQPASDRPVDLDAERAQWEVSARRGSLVQWGWAAFFVALFTSNVFLLDGLAPRFWGWLLVAVLLFWGVAWWLDRRADRRAGGPSSPGPSSEGEVRSLAPGADIWAAVRQALHVEGFQFPYLIDAHTLEARRGSELARQYRVTVRVVADGEGGALVKVWSRPVVGWWVSAWSTYGRPRRVANAVLRAVPEAQPVD